MEEHPNPTAVTVQPQKRSRGCPKAELPPLSPGVPLSPPRSPGQPRALRGSSPSAPARGCRWRPPRAA